MTFGRPIFHTLENKPAVVATIGPRDAIAETLAEYLRCAVFRVWGKDAPDRTFALQAIHMKWPDAGKALEYPAASIVEQTDTFHEALFVPFPLEDTLGVYDCMVVATPDPQLPRTVLWKTAEASVEFQLDFWCSNDPDRQAIEAQLGYLFNPGQERTGVLLGGHPRYYAREVRATLLSHRQIDIEDSVYPNERRLQCAVRCEVDVVDLRLAVLLSPEATVEVTDPSDPGDAP